jgi:hypothetical protein
MTDNRLPRGIESTSATPLESVRRLEAWFFGDEGFSVRRMIDYLLEEASLCGVSRVDVREMDGWWVLSADQDWLPDTGDALKVFQALTPYPEGGPNGSRMEVLLTAFARAVVTARSGTIAVIVEDEWTNRWIDEHKSVLTAQRVIAFATP